MNKRQNNNVSHPAKFSEINIGFNSVLSSKVLKKSLIFLIPLLIISIVIGLILVNEFQKLTILNLQKDQELFINLEADFIDDDFEVVLSDLQYIGAQADRLLLDYNSGLNIDGLRDLEYLISLKLDITNIYKKIVILDYKGDEILHIDKVVDQVIIVPNAEYQNKSDRYYFEKSQQLLPGQIFISRMRLQEDIGEIVQLESPIIRFIKVLGNNMGESKGYLILYYDANRIFDRISFINQSKQDISILDAIGYWLYGSSSEKKWGFQIPDRKNETFANHHPVVWNVMNTKTQGSIMNNEGSTLFAKINLFENLKLPFETEDDSYPWIIASFIPHHVIANINLQNCKWIIIFIVLIVALLGNFIFTTVRTKESLISETNKLTDLYFSVVNTQQELIARYKPDSTITFVNPAYCKSMGKSQQELLGQKYLQYIPPELHQEELESLSRLNPSHPIDTREFEVIRVEGEQQWQEWTDVAIFNESGEIIEIQGVGRDITDRKKAEEKIQTQLNRLSALRIIDNEISGIINLQKVMKTAIDQITTQLKMDAVSIILYDKQENNFNVAIEVGFHNLASEENLIYISNEVFNNVILNQQTIHIQASSQPPDNPLAEWMDKENFKNYIAIPMLANGQPIGILEIFHRKQLEVTREWFSFLETLAGQVANAINSSKLIKDLQQSTLELIEAYDTTIEGWSYALDLRDEETEGHTQRVTDMTLKLARTAGFAEEELVHVRRGSLLHDIGKIGVSDHILLKPGKLTEEEWAEMRKHPVFAFNMLSRIDYLKPAIDIPYCHHEKWDGTGYPRGLKGDQIPFSARLFAVVDVWDALRSDRPYRPAWSYEKVMEHIKNNSGSHFDPQAVDLFLKMMLAPD